MTLAHDPHAPAVPAASMRVVALIYWNALRLKLKGAPYHPHPGR